MAKERMTDDKLYEIILNTKHHEEVRRDEIGKYYTSLFTAMVALMPVIEKFSEMGEANKVGTLVNYLLILLSVIGISISISWVLALKRIYNYIEGFDSLLTKLEQKHNQPFISYMSSFLSKISSPDRVTKQAMWLPYTFFTIFAFTLAYNLYNFSLKGV
ncbi:MAG: hypothetical protein Tsb006_5470 [Rickettsiaceae bacterium]